MKLYHYSEHDAVAPRSIEQGYLPSPKPGGLWLSDCDDGAQGWREWCQGEDFSLHRLAHRYEAQVDTSRVLVMTGKDLLKFTRTYAPDAASKPLNVLFIDWGRVAQLYAGVIITPYSWGHRMSLAWYYGWDCASGCIWDVSAITHFTREQNYVFEK